MGTDRQIVLSLLQGRVKAIWQKLVREKIALSFLCVGSGSRFYSFTKITWHLLMKKARKKGSHQNMASSCQVASAKWRYIIHESSSATSLYHCIVSPLKEGTWRVSSVKRPACYRQV